MVIGKVGSDNVHSGGGVMAISAEPSKQNYTVKSVENVVLGADVQARIFTLAPGEVIPWHLHSETTDYYFVLSGRLTIETRSPADRRKHSLSASDTNDAWKYPYAFKSRKNRQSISASAGRRQIRLDQSRKRTVGLFRVMGQD